MTKELIKKIAKVKKVNLAYYDSVIGFINEQYTKITIIFAAAQVCGGVKKYYHRETINLSVAAIIKKGELIPEDYETEGWRWLDEIR